VEADGKQFEVFLMRIEPGWEYELRGRWLDENDPRVIAMKEQTQSALVACVFVSDGGC